MSGALKGKNVLITGGARGMGAAHCSRLAGEGAQVLCVDVNPEGHAVAEELAGAGLSVEFHQADVSASEDWARMIDVMERKFGGLDVLVNNAGVLALSDAVECAESEWDRTIDVNQKGVFLGMKHAVPAMRRRGGGSIVNVSSIYGLVGAVGYSAYCASKGAVTLMTKAAAVTYGPDSIRVNSVHPGVVFTEMLEAELAGLPPTALEDFLAATPLRRGADPDEVSKCVLFLASDQSSFVTGVELVVDGGLLAGR